MAALKDKISNLLQECRILILGAEVMLGLHFELYFQQGFQKLPSLEQHLYLAALALMMTALALLLFPAPYHCIAESSEDSASFHRFAMRLMRWPLLPMGVSLGIDFYLAASVLLGKGLALGVGIASAFFALFMWYGLAALPLHSPGEAEQDENQDEKEDAMAQTLKDKIEQALAEARMVLPGAQALLGFQFIAVFTQAFESLPAPSKLAHFASICCISLSLILLMSPAAYHRIAEKGEFSEHFLAFSGRMILAAMCPLALGLALDFFVVSEAVLHSSRLALVLSALLLAGFYGLWFGYSLYGRSRKRRAQAA